MFSQILIYTRPWEISFGLTMAEELGKCFPRSPIRFVTFFKLCCDTLKKDARYDFIYLPELLNTVTGDELTLEEISALDRLLFEKSGANLNMMLGSERFLPRQGMLKEAFCRKHLVALNRLILPGTLSVSSMFDHFVYWLAGALALANGGYHFAFCASGLPPNRTTIFKTPWETWKVSRPRHETDQLLAETIEKMSLPVEQRIGYMKKIVRPSLKARFSRRILEFRCSVFDWKTGSYFVSKNPYMKMMKRLFLPVIPNSHFYGYTAHSVGELDTSNYRYIFCPLHYEPEAVINMFSPWLRDQVEMCRLITQALPAGVKLIVKDHPLMTGIRKKKYYEKIKELPDIVLVPSQIQSVDLVNLCIGVITLSGTTTNEAAVLGKPSICLARPPFRKNVQFFDFAADMRLHDLHSIFLKWIEEKRREIDLNVWNGWVSSQIDASLVPEMNNVSWEIVPDRHKVESFISFIKKTIINE